MPANTPAVRLLQPFYRQNVMPVIPAAQWVDNLVLVAGAAKSYTLPTGLGPQGQTLTASIFRITANGGPVWLNANGGTAAVPAADNLDGDGPVCIPAGRDYWLSIPKGGQPLSFIASDAVVLCVEAWT